MSENVSAENIQHSSDPDTASTSDCGIVTLSENEIRCIVVGKTGNGKSSAINTIAGKRIFVAKPSQISVTKECQLAEIDVDGKCLLVVDTPGLYDTDLKLEETLTEVGKVMGITSPGFHAFIVVVKVGRFTAEEKDTIEKLAEKFGPELYTRAVILFTSTDDLEADGMSFEEYVEGHIHDDLKKIISKCGERTVGFNNRASEEARKIQVRKLMVLLQDIIESNNNTYYTNEVYKQIEKKIEEERQKQLKADKTVTADQVTRKIRRSIQKKKGYGEQFLGWFRGSSCVIS